jgi:outer membrane protein assembly factor BamB
MLRRLLVVFASATALIITALAFAAPASPTTALVTPSPWLMFHRDERHTGVITSAVGNINPASGPFMRWKYKVTDPPASDDDLKVYRWYSSFPLGDLDGDGTLEVIVTTPDNTSFANRIIALKDQPNQSPPVRALWTYTHTTLPPGGWGLDQYSAALVDADGDGLLDVVYASKDGFVRALKGTNGQPIWEYQTNHFIEAGPMIADLNGDGQSEVIAVTDCAPASTCVSNPGTKIADGSLFVFTATFTNSLINTPTWSVDFPNKIDSAEPAIADIDPNDGQSVKAIVVGSWAGRMYLVWRNPSTGDVVSHSLELSTLISDSLSSTPAIRSSPLLMQIGGEWRTVFGWMPEPGNGQSARISAIQIEANILAGTASFTPLWTIDRDDWKSSIALLPIDPNNPRVVVGYGIGNAPNTGTGNYGNCDPTYLSGGILAISPTGTIAWEHNFGATEGNIRGTPAVADIDGDGKLEVILTMGCFGKIHAYDGTTGTPEWDYQLGPRTIGTASLGDLDGDGYLEIVVPSYDGNVWVLNGGHRVHLPIIQK